METSPASAIRLNLHNLAQLFNPLDPSPFVERDLAADAEEFITSWARELPTRHNLELVIILSTSTPPTYHADVENAVRRYFATRAEIKQLELAQLMRRGRLSLCVGLLFLVLCLTLGELVDKAGSGSAVGIVKEGFTIAGWVAMWRPLEIYLYDWWPLYEERRRLERLARIKVRIITPEAELHPFAEGDDPVRGAFTASAA